MKKYDEYKDSGVEWIGEVPGHWRTCRFKDFMKLQTEASISENKIGLENIESKSGKFIETNTEFEGNGIAFAENDIVYGKLRPYLQKVWLAEFDGNAVGDFFVFKAKVNSVPTYIKYLLLSDGFTKEADGSTVGAKMPRVSSNFILTMHYCLPPLSEQRTIATYLDKKCGEIDKVISVQQQRIALLQELKQSVITHAVTKGLDPNVEMKNSGVEWIGEVPKHWEVIRTRYLCDSCTGNKDTINKVDEGIYPFYVRSPKVERINTYSFDGEAILMAGDGVGAGKVFHYATGKFDYHQRVYNFHNFKRVIGKYFFHYIANNFKYVIEEGGAKNTVDSVRLYMIQNFLVTVPPKEEQEEICKYIYQRVNVLDSSISKAQHQIDLLQEYKQSLVTEVVTGKRKVS